MLPLLVSKKLRKRTPGNNFIKTLTLPHPSSHFGILPDAFVIALNIPPALIMLIGLTIFVEKSLFITFHYRWKNTLIFQQIIHILLPNIVSVYYLHISNLTPQFFLVNQSFQAPTTSPLML